MLFIYLYVCILACEFLLVVWVRDCVSHMRFYERVSVHHQRWRERWKVVGLAGRFQWGRAELTDIQEELVVTLLPFTKLPRGQTRVVQQLTDYRQVTLLCLLVKGKERGWKFTLIQDSRLGLHDISHAIVMRISSVKTVLWLAVNLHHLFSNGAAFNTQSRRSLTSYAISRSLSHAIHLRFWAWIA